MARYLRERLAFVVSGLFVAGLFVSAGAASQDPWKILDDENDPASHKVFTAARVDLRNERYDEAIKGLKKAAEMRNGQCVECYALMAQAYFRMGKIKDAASAQKQAVAINPEADPELYNQLGVYLYKENDKKTLQEAVEAFQRAIDLSKGKVALAYFNLGHALIKQGREAEGIQALNTYLEADPGSNNAGEARAIIASPKLVNAVFAPAFSARSFSGDDLSLERLRGKIVLLDFWATWCGPCRQEMPAVKEIWKKYRDNQFVIVGISLDQDRGSLKRYLDTEGITWPQVYDGAGSQSGVARLYGVRGIPHTVLIDQDGIVRAVGLRGGTLSSKIGELIKKLPRQEAAHTQGKL